MRNVSEKFVPRPLTAELKEHCMSAASDLLKCAEADNFF
jgi:hypothetical protein